MIVAATKLYAVRSPQENEPFQPRRLFQLAVWSNYEHAI
jgi:hypothetical protein